MPPELDDDQQGQKTEQTEAPKTALEVMNAAIDAVSGTDADDELLAKPAEGEGDEVIEVATQPAAKIDAGAPAVGAAADKKPAVVEQDDIYKMPDGLQAKSQERFARLVESNKAKDSEITQMREAHDWLRTEVLTDDEAPQDLVGFATYRKALRSGDFATARQLLQAQAQQLALASGQPFEIDAFAQFPDLKQKMADMELDESAAYELARGRQQQAQLQAQQQQQYQNQQAALKQQQDVQAVIQQVETMAKGWAASDIDFAAKEKILVAKIPGILQQFPPHLVPAQVRMLYETLSEVSPAKTQQPPPLRGTGRVAGKAAPASALDAMNQALGYT